MFKNMGGNIPGWNFPGENFLGGTLMGWYFPGGSFPDTGSIVTPKYFQRLFLKDYILLSIYPPVFNCSKSNMETPK